MSAGPLEVRLAVRSPLRVAPAPRWPRSAG